MNREKDIFDEMVEAYPYPKVLTSRISDFSFGLISGKSIANLASIETGTPIPLKVGKKNLYDKYELAAWFRERYPINQ